MARIDPQSAGPSSSGLKVLSLNMTKAGMEGLDKDKINAIVAEASKGSKFYEAKLKNQVRIDSQVEEMNRKLRVLSNESLASALRQADHIMESLKAERDLSRVIVHVDMDAFYAAVEERDNPALKDKPMAVGSMGMLSTSNYLARKFGVRAAMPGFIGKKLCPQLTIVPPNFEKYTAVSKVVREVFSEYDPEFCPVSLDEAYLDVTDYLEAQRSFGNLDITAGEVVSELRTKICQRTTLTASAGIAPNSFLAKVCSDQNKPNGQFELPPDVDEIMKFVESLPIRKVSGIGNVTEQLLKRVLCIETCGDLYDKRGHLLLLFSDISAGFFLRTSLGLGSTRISDMSSRERKSMSTETTFSETSEKDELFSIVDSLCVELSNDLLSESLKGTQLTVKIKTHKFSLKTRAANLFQPSNDVTVLQQTAKRVLQGFMDSSSEKPLKLRLIGVRMSGFKERYEEFDFEGKRIKQQQSTIENFLSGGSSKASTDILLTSTFSCPVCRQEIRVSTENAFNSHLDTCLDQSELNSSKSESAIREEDSKDSIVEKEVSTKIKYVKVKNLASTPFCYNCPICDRDIQASSEREFNQHLDKCLEQKEEKRTLLANDTNVTPKTSNLTSKITEEVARKTETNFFGRNSKKVSEILDCKVTAPITEREFLGEDIEKEKSKVSNLQNEESVEEKAVEANCPICGLEFIESTINSHIDECLNKDTIDNLRHEQQQHQQASNSEQRKRRFNDPQIKRDGKRSRASKDCKNKSILNYFQSKPTT